MWDKSASSVGKSLHTGSKFMDFSIFSTKVCEKFASMPPLGLRIAGLNCSVLSSTGPAVPWNSRGFDSMPKLAVKVCIHLLNGAFCRTLSVPAVPGIYPGFGRKKVNIPAFPRPRGEPGCK